MYKNPPPRAFHTKILRGILHVYEGPSDLWCVCACVCVCGSHPSSSLGEQRGSQTGERSSGSDGGDRQWQNVQRGEMEGREGEAKRGPAQTNTLTRKPQQQETREVNNDSRNAEHKLEGWINSHKADWEPLKRPTTCRLVWMKVCQLKRALLARQKLKKLTQSQWRFWLPSEKKNVSWVST